MRDGSCQAEPADGSRDADPVAQRALALDRRAQVSIGRLVVTRHPRGKSCLLEEVGCFGRVIGDVYRGEEVAGRLIRAAQRRRARGGRLQ
jgi:hypothetical protein